jgi:hypothetical protein
VVAAAVLRGDDSEREQPRNDADNGLGRDGRVGDTELWHRDEYRRTEHRPDRDHSEIAEP